MNSQSGGIAVVSAILSNSANIFRIPSFVDCDADRFR